MNTCTLCKTLITQKEVDLAESINGGGWDTMCASCALECPPAESNTETQNKNFYTVAIGTDSVETTEAIKAYTLAGAEYLAEQRAQEWLEDGEFVSEDGEGFEVQATWQIFGGMNLNDNLASLGSRLAYGNVTYTVEPDHDLLIEKAGGNAGCKHEWTALYEVEGGMKENPGMWSTGGTTFVYADHCSKCSLARRRTNYGSQRNYGQVDKVEYSKMKYPLPFEVRQQLTELQDNNAFGGELEEREYVLSITLDELETVCEELLTDNWNKLGFNPDGDITGEYMAKFLKNHQS